MQQVKDLLIMDDTNSFTDKEIRSNISLKAFIKSDIYNRYAHLNYLVPRILRDILGLDSLNYLFKLDIYFS